MLVITRAPGEMFYLDGPGFPRITVKVLRTQGQEVRIGVDADRSIKILRAELEVRDNHPVLPFTEEQTCTID